MPTGRAPRARSRRPLRRSPCPVRAVDLRGLGGALRPNRGRGVQAVRDRQKVDDFHSWDYTESGRLISPRPSSTDPSGFTIATSGRPVPPARRRGSPRRRRWREDLRRKGRRDLDRDGRHPLLSTLRSAGARSSPSLAHQRARGRYPLGIRYQAPLARSAPSASRIRSPRSERRKRRNSTGSDGDWIQCPARALA